MKKKTLDLIREGKLDSALSAGEEFLSEIKDYYYSWILLQSRFQDKQNENLKGILSQEKYTNEINKVNSDLLELILKIEECVKANFQSDNQEKRSLKDRLQDSLIATYEILDVISEGKSTVTFKAKERFEDDLIAIRALKSDNLFLETEAFDEVSKVKKLQHRNIVTVFGKSPRNTTPKYVVMDYIQGIDLKSLVLENGPKPLSEAKRILLKICDALYYLHKRKIFNADLRAARILIDREGEPMISPFIVFRSKSENNYGQIISNLKYMSYQRLNSKDYKHHTPQSNQFSLGVIAYLLLSGEMLFDSDSIIDLIEARSQFEKNEKVRQEKIEKISGPPELIEILKKLLSPIRKNRYASMLEVIHAIRSIEDFSNEFQKTARESFSRACSYNPQIMHNLIEGINSQEIESNEDSDSMALKMQNIIGLLIETNASKSYIDKVIELKSFSDLLFRDFEKFKQHLFTILEESDYLWTDQVRKAWEQTLSETHEGFKNRNSTGKGKT
jgi:serine/threonine protein kinase